MAKTRKQKEEIVVKLQEKVSRAKAMVFADYKGLSMKQLSNLRNQLQEQNAEFTITKNNLLEKAISQFSILAPSLKLWSVGDNSQFTVDPLSGILSIPQAKMNQITLTSDVGNIGISFDGSNIVYTGNQTTNQLLTASSPAFTNLTSKVDNLTTQVATSSAQIADLSQQLASLSAQLAYTEASQSASSSAALSDNSQFSILNSQLNLTPPDVLLATGSAQLANITVTSEATFSAKLTAYDLNIQNSLKSLGQTTLGNTLIAGDLNVDGTLSITGESLSNLSTLYIQNSLLATGVDFFNGKVKIDKEGKLSIEKLEVSAETLGTVILTAGQTELVISSDQLTDKSKVFVTPEKPAVLGVSKDLVNKTFTIKLDKVLSSDLKIDWWIVDQQGSD